MVKTEDQLKSEWGQKRFVIALGILSKWFLDKQHPVSEKQIEQLLSESEDAFTLFASRTYYRRLANNAIQAD